jgi:tRNA nucleotidyltransferase (CCA-adding enzyme)
VIDILIPGDVNIIMEKLKENGYKSYVVGGAIRNGLLNIPVKDWDICTNAKPNEMLEVFKDFKIIETGIKHGTITIVLNDNNYEVTTFRVDGNYSDNRRPDSVEFVDNIISDLSRRDFTINAMAYNKDDGLIDPFDGFRDLSNKIVACVLLPNDRFKEDALRMLRAIRFSSQLGFKIEKSTGAAIIKNSELINNISKERINSEITKILMSDHLENIYDLYKYGLLKYIIPDLYNCFGVDQNNKFHKYDVGNHIITALSYAPKDLEIRLALMLHDIGKPIRRTTTEDGLDHFYEHEITSSKLAESWLREYKFDNVTIENVTKLVLYHDSLVHPKQKSIKRLLNAVGLDIVKKLIEVRKCDILAQADYMKEEKLKLLEESREKLNEIILKEEAFEITDLKINGDDLKMLGYKEGKKLGDSLKKMLDMVIDNSELNTKEELYKVAEELLWN